MLINLKQFLSNLFQHTFNDFFTVCLGVALMQSNNYPTYYSKKKKTRASTQENVHSKQSLKSLSE